MGTATLTIDLDAIVANWRALDGRTDASTETAAVVKADAYGLGIARVASALRDAGARKFFVAVAEEGAALRQALGPEAEIMVFSGHMAGDTDLIRGLGLVPMLNSIEQITRHVETLPGARFGLQLDTGMNRLGIEPDEWAAIRDIVLPRGPVLVMSHLACADDRDDARNARQLRTFREMTDGISAPRSLAATGGILLGPGFHFDLTRPGIGLYGGRPFADARPVLRLSLPVIQCRDVASGEIVGYGGSFEASAPTRIATLSAGYADGLIRAMGGEAVVFHGAVPCPLAGRVSMDLLTVDIGHLDTDPSHLDILGRHQGVDDLADSAGTIGYEILTSLGPRYVRNYAGI
ncbi:alanine racemase [Palleronia aestuarii]|uniref:Alanine racemase n=1 Tax=Palleronia aestuarii TaxID=568105 RepID=A0A2W7NNZ6_9RHOB|nr:alanine racemase [Palleronia aestuarii]PZX18324.1 alanine racemase [Palleronia aestuarii]